MNREKGRDALGKEAPLEMCEMFDVLGTIARCAGPQKAGEPFAALALDRADPLGAAIAQMVRRLRLGALRQLGGSETRTRNGTGIVVGAAALADVWLVVAGLDDADQELMARGESSETPGASELRHALGTARCAVAVVVANGARSVRQIAVESSERPPRPGRWGGQKALAQIVHEHGASLRRTLARLGVATRELEDVAQEVLCAVGRGLPMFDPSRAAGPEQAMKGWLSGICSRQAANHHRKVRRRAEDLRENEELDGWPSGSTSVEERWIAEEESTLLRALIDGLEPARRAVVVAHDLEQVPMAEVAALLGIPLNTAWNRLRLGRSDLRAAWQLAEHRSNGRRGSKSRGKT